MKVVTNVYEDHYGEHRFCKINSEIDNILRKSAYNSFIGTKTEEIEPPMREVEKEIPILVDLTGRIETLSSIPPWAYGFKLTYKVKEKV